MCLRFLPPISVVAATLKLSSPGKAEEKGWMCQKGGQAKN